MKTLEQAQEDIRLYMLGIYYSSWSKVLTDDMKGRTLYITPIQGQYGKGAGFLFTIEGTPPRGMLYFEPEFRIAQYCRSPGGYWNELRAKKYCEMRIILDEWFTLYEEARQ